jgi:HAD superfamily hydrolase (TIGR01484 family)
MPTNNRIAAVFSDLDGTLTPSKGDVNPDALKKLAEELKDPNSPKLSIVTGRSQPYVANFVEKLLLYGVPIKMPLVCENGSIIYDPTSGKSILNPLINKKDSDELIELKKLIIDKVLLKYPGAKIEPGKVVTVSINPPKDKNIEVFYPEFINDDDIKGKISQFSVTRSKSAVDISPKNITKLVGIKYVLKVRNIKEGDVAAIGDAENDRVVLENFNYLGTPKNGEDSIKKYVMSRNGYVSQYPDTLGVADFIEKCTEINKRINSNGNYSVLKN